MWTCPWTHSNASVWAQHQHPSVAILQAPPTLGGILCPTLGPTSGHALPVAPHQVPHRSQHLDFQQALLLNLQQTPLRELQWAPLLAQHLKPLQVLWLGPHQGQQLLPPLAPQQARLQGPHQVLH